MSCLSLPQPAQSKIFSKIRLVATDMDGTLTTKGKFTNTLLQALQDLAAANIKIIIVTGRSAGWVSGLAYYFPVVGAIAANGGFFFSSLTESLPCQSPLVISHQHRHALQAGFKTLKRRFFKN